jgi:tetratricopeptide (TPR) repeat protein
MDKSKKNYIKSLDMYNRGYIYKAMELCEESISIEIKNSAAINLKGLLYYLQGDLESAQRFWKMNYEINKDSVSQKYLNDTEKDKEKLKLYKLALGLINELKIHEAIELLLKCSESDYNFIGVNNYLALCYIKKGDYDKAIIYIDNVFKIDINNEMAKKNRDDLKNIGVIRKYINIKKVFRSLLFIVAIILFIVTARIFMKQIKSEYEYIESAVKTIKLMHNKQQTTKNEFYKSSDKDYKSQTKPKSEVFPQDTLNNDLQSQNFEDIYEIYIKWKDRNISIDSKITLSKAEELLKNQGVEYFYNKGYNFINNKDYLNAKQYFLKAYYMGEQSYLYPHIIYMLGSSFYLSGDVENAIKYYTQYNEEFSDGVYEDTVLYTLVTIYKDLDKVKAQSYAKELVQKYPSSIYNNSVIQGVINTQ